MRTDLLSARDLKTPRTFFSDRARAVRLGCLVRQALIAEAELTPKPGLVDRRGAGAHTDLSLAIMRRSALAIEPYFCEMALVSGRNHPSQRLRERLAVIGREAEGAMLKVTSGSNAHKGAIWVLGLLVSAAAMQDEDEVSAPAIAATAKEIASFEDRATPRLVTHGDVVAKRYGVAGARGEALGGFPHVVNVALQMLHSWRASGAKEDVARLDAFLCIMSHLTIHACSSAVETKRSSRRSTVPPLSSALGVVELRSEGSDCSVSTVASCSWESPRVGAEIF